ncbi:hypothetical protein [Bdellovibrio sp. HCB-162]|uniref:hypothetical protein n=1 Tax=Bdellovibrio sp. HCB-162 TaxID=3394234 RepID=UPI0039BC4FD2
MKLFIPFSFLFYLVFLQACSSFEKREDTIAPSALDGAWLKVSCTCVGKDTILPEVQEAHTMIINGNFLLQSQTARWRKPEWMGYCSLIEEAKINRASNDIYDVVTVSKRTLSPSGVSCDVLPGKSKRTWKVLTVNKSELKYESTSGCEAGPFICSFKRLE